MTRVFSSVLVANRGEIAVRVMATLRRLGIDAVAVFGPGDADARHVREADVALDLGPGGYLDVEAVVAATVRSGAEAIHPGYGFLSENAALARACAAAGVVFVGPSEHALTVMGDKIRARRAVEERGVLTVPGVAEPGLDDDALVAAALDVGLPVLVKPSAGGGGKGMHVVRTEAELRPALASARREAASAFGDDTLFVERFVRLPRHIEVQVLADDHGTTLHLGERECSLQRRHQKVIEEAPSPLLADEAGRRTRQRLGEAAVETARAVGYTGAGTVEFLVSGERPDEFFFLEMNTRLQVEHPVTELVTGLDLVEQQLRVAAGEPLGLAQGDLRVTGHAVEARVYAEDPRTGLPTGGRVLALAEPSGEHVRVDSGLVAEVEVSARYDPMLAKVVAWGPDRAAALRRLDRALARTAVLGVTTNLELLRLLLADPDVRAGRLDTGLVERRLPELAAPAPPAAVLAAAALHALVPDVGPRSLWDAPTGWRLGRSATTTLTLLDAAGSEHRVGVTGPPLGRGASVRVDDGPATPARLERSAAGTAAVTLDGRSTRFLVADDGPALWLHDLGGTLGSWAFTRRTRVPRRTAAQEHDPELRSPLPGTVVAVLVEDGAAVAAGDRVLVVEAMKMEHTLTAPTDGVVALRTGRGRSVSTGQVLAVVEPAGGKEGS